MASTSQYEVIAVMKSGEIQRVHSTDYNRAIDAYTNISAGECLYKVVWQTVDHSPLDPRVIRSYSR